MSPGVGFGANGEGYVRFALVENEHRIRQAVRNLGAFLRAQPEPGERKTA
jgi:alanine-synthesizing transaminase